MNRTQLEHIIRAAGAIAEDDEIIIFGSQAILGQFPDAPPSLLVSVEADIFPKNQVDRVDVIDGSIGEGSPFQRTFGYYAHGVSPDVAILPEGWEERLIAVKNENTGGVTGFCVEVHDLALSKYAAGREQDKRYTKDLVATRYIEKKILLERLHLLPVEQALRTIIEERIVRDFSQ